ncbi:MAG: cellulase family glycosylhydrolase [Kiritimatiellae bacterium]|nr:cellulase family glycosylhydrolase [Kiritimatiellia bacterium]
MRAVSRFGVWLLLAACFLAASCSVQPPSWELEPEAPSAPVPVVEEEAVPLPEAPVAAARPSLLRAQGTKIVDAEGRPVILKGCNLGNWLLLEMWMLDLREIQDQHQFEAILAERFGAAKKDHLMEVYRENWIRARDFEVIRRFGFNTVRLPFNCGLLEDEGRPFELKPDAFKWLDRAIEMAKEHKLYVILDLHGVPGGQSLDHTTGQAGRNRLWTDPQAQERTVWLWKQIAARYRDSATVAAYDVINEPFGDGKTDAHLDALVALVDNLYWAIRSVDPEHLIFIPGAHQGIEFYGAPSERGWSNVGFTEHYYPGLFGGEPSRDTHARFIARKIAWRAGYLERIQAPFLVGEFNVVFQFVGGAALMRHYYDLYASKGWAATMWSYKLVQKQGGMPEDTWCMVKNRADLAPLSPATASADQIEVYFRWLGSMDYSYYDNLGAALTMKAPPAIQLPPYGAMPIEPPAVDPLVSWEASDIGGALAGGQRILSESVWEVFGGGEDIWKDRDQFRFVWKQVTGDFDLQATVTSIADSHLYAKAGLMVRTGLDPDDAHFLVHVFPDGEVVMGWRGAKGAIMEQKTLARGIFPARLRLRRDRDTLDVGYSEDGKKWMKNTVRLSEAFGPKCYVGLAVLSHDNGCLTTARFEDIRFDRY